MEEEIAELKKENSILTLYFKKLSNWGVYWNKERINNYK
jgi:hypothetical protein